MLARLRAVDAHLDRFLGVPLTLEQRIAAFAGVFDRTLIRFNETHGVRILAVDVYTSDVAVYRKLYLQSGHDRFSVELVLSGNELMLQLVDLDVSSHRKKVQLSTDDDGEFVRACETALFSFFSNIVGWALYSDRLLHWWQSAAKAYEGQTISDLTRKEQREQLNPATLDVFTFSFDDIEFDLEVTYDTGLTLISTCPFEPRWRHVVHIADDTSTIPTITALLDQVKLVYDRWH